VGIYTKTGDAGRTGLLSGRRVDKDDARVAAYGELDELNAVLGLARAQGLDASISVSVGASRRSCSRGLAAGRGGEGRHPALPRVKPDWTSALEREIDAADAEMPSLRRSSSPAARRAPAGCTRAHRLPQGRARGSGASHREEVDSDPVAYVNRLSDWLFTMARLRTTGRDRGADLAQTAVGALAARPVAAGLRACGFVTSRPRCPRGG
jgi:cob(I)alamin adenosyltransferase